MMVLIEVSRRSRRSVYHKVWEVVSLYALPGVVGLVALEGLVGLNFPCGIEVKRERRER